jgi:hypothetical protein
MSKADKLTTYYNYNSTPGKYPKEHIQLPPSLADCLEIWDPQLRGTLRACPSLLQGLLFTFCLKFRLFVE